MLTTGDKNEELGKLLGKSDILVYPSFFFSLIYYYYFFFFAREHSEGIV